jgi:FtsZ-interacting cell division protein ZipA
MDAQEFRGLNVFSVLPGPMPPLRMLEELVALARGLAHRLSAVVQDEQGADLDGVRLTQIRQSLQQAAGTPGDGTAP